MLDDAAPMLDDAAPGEIGAVPADAPAAPASVEGYNSADETEAGPPLPMPVAPPAGELLSRFPSAAERAVVGALFNRFAKSPAFRQPSRLLSKVGFAIHDGLAKSSSTSFSALSRLKGLLGSVEAMQFAEHVCWAQGLPADDRALLQVERSAAFAASGGARKASDAAPTEKQLAYLRSLGCPTVPANKLQAGELITRHMR
jgi:hypothetical protein